MKRAADAIETPEGKFAKTDDNLAADLEKVQKQITDLDDECRAEQVAVQCRYDRLKTKFFDQRAELLKKIPNFWKAVLINSCHTGEGHLIHEKELEALDSLIDVRLEDNLDKRGSHKFTFEFKENDFFKETKLVKEVKVVDDDNVDITVTPITWTKNITEEMAEQDYSFFKWFLRSEEDDEGDFGSIFRETVWEDALNIYAHEEECEEVEEGEEE